MNFRLALRFIAGGTFIAAGLVLAAFSAPPTAREHPGKTLYSFAGSPDGGYPNGDLIEDDAGIYYGTTSAGGIITSDCSAGCGTVYKIADGVESVLYSFAGGSDGAVPYDGLYRDASGNLYGVTRAGGSDGMGTVFKIAPDGTKTTLHNFVGGTNDGAEPNGDLVADADGNLYGTTYTGGIGHCDGGCGTIFKITPAGEESVIHALAGGEGLEGAGPQAGLIANADGNFYGTTYGGGGNPNCGPLGCGTIFKITAAGELTVLHSFEGWRSAGHPRDLLVMDAEGNFYGTTYNGGEQRLGAVWEVSSTGAEIVLRSFQGNADGEGVLSGLVADSTGALYGMTTYGGDDRNGTLFRISTNGRIAIIYTFPNADTLEVPAGRLLINRKGNFVGATLYSGIKNCGSYGCGTLFEVRN